MVSTEEKIKEKLVQALRDSTDFSEFLDFEWMDADLIFHILSLSIFKDSFEYHARYVDGLVEVSGENFNIITSYKIYFFFDENKAVFQLEDPKISFPVNLQKILEYKKQNT